MGPAVLRPSLRLGATVACLWAAALTCGACGDSGSSLDSTEGRAARDAYAAHVLASYEDVLDRARVLDQTIDALIAAPSDETLTAAQGAWVRAREAYATTEAFRFYGGPIDHRETGVLVPLAAGWREIERLLFGHQDRDPNELKTLASRLIEHLQQLVDAWSLGADNYAAAWKVLAPNEAVRRMFTGAGVFASHELAGERMSRPLDTRDLESVRFRASGNTLAEILGNYRGIREVYVFALKPLVQSSDARFDLKLDKRMMRTRALLEQIPEPFDLAVLGDEDTRARIAAKVAIDSLRQLAALLVEAAAQLGIEIDLEPPA